MNKLCDNSRRRLIWKLKLVFLSSWKLPAFNFFPKFFCFLHKKDSYRINQSFNVKKLLRSFKTVSCLWTEGSKSESRLVPLQIMGICICSRILQSASKNSKKNLDSYCFVTFCGLFIFEKLCKCTFKKQKANIFLQKFSSWRSMTKIAGSGSGSGFGVGSISQRHGTPSVSKSA